MISRHSSLSPHHYTTDLYAAAAANHSRREGSPDLDRSSDAKPRIIVISNRLPITCSRKDDGTWDFKMSSGGLVAALSGVDRSQHEFVWLGWVGCEIPAEEQLDFQTQLWEKHKCIPVFLDDALADAHYNGFSNGILWPLFHYVPLETHSVFDPKLWESYQAANVAFANVVNVIAGPNDLLWVHDYHLMLLPQYIRAHTPTARIGFFLHIPFPSSEIFKKLPVRKEILEATLCSDLIGFHTYDYARHFIQSCAYLLDGIEISANGLYVNAHHAVVGAFPVGIEPDKFEKQLQTTETQTRIKELMKSFSGKQVIIGVDRLDYIKGIPHKLRALKRLFNQHPEWREKLVLVQIAVPTRLDVPEYQELKCEVEELVGSINGQFSTISSSPIHYLFTSVGFGELCALYSIADAILITSIRDGMNLVCQEYIACQAERKGQVILSEFAGAASCLASAHRVNPWNAQEVADKIHEVLTLPKERRDRLHEIGAHYVQTYTSKAWGKKFMDELKKHTARGEQVTPINHLKYEDLLGPYRAAKNRLIVINYDGGLIDYRRENFKATSRPSSRVLFELRRLCSDPRNTVYIYSGRERDSLHEWFGMIPSVGLVGENGFFIKKPNEDKWFQLESSLDMGWMDRIRPVLEYFALRTPGSEIQQKEVHMTWHYRRCRPDFGIMQARELQHTIGEMHDVVVEVIHDNDQKIVEVRPPISTATMPLMNLFNDLSPDFVLHLGTRSTAAKIREHFQDRVDERNLFTCMVATTVDGPVPRQPLTGTRNSYLSRSNEALDLVGFLAETSEASQHATEKAS